MNRILSCHVFCLAVPSGKKSYSADTELQQIRQLAIKAVCYYIIINQYDSTIIPAHAHPYTNPLPFQHTRPYHSTTTRCLNPSAPFNISTRCRHHPRSRQCRCRRDRVRKYCVCVSPAMSKATKRFYRSDSVYNLQLDKGALAAEENRYVFEISHEAANKGGYAS